MKRWATAREIHEDILPNMAYNSITSTASILARHSRTGRIQRRLGKRTMRVWRGHMTTAEVWEYYVPEARHYLSQKPGKGNKSVDRTSTGR